MNKQIMTGSLTAFLVASCSVLAQPKSSTPLWVYDAGQTIQGSPAVASDGTVYIGVGNALHAITNAGSVVSNKWIFTSGLSTVGAPAIGSEGIVYVSGSKLCAVNPDGSEKWSYPGIGNGCPAIGRDGTVYSQGGSSLDAISPGGVKKWSAAAGANSFFSSAVIGSQGDIYVNSVNVHAFFAVTPDGTGGWYASTGYFNPADSAAIAADGSIYFSAGLVYAFSPSGSNVWGVLTAGYAASPVVGKDGTIYVEAIYPGPAFTGYGLGLYALSPSGDQKWVYQTNLFSGPAQILNTPAIDSAGVLYCTAYTGLFAVSAEGSLLWSFSTDDYSQTSPAIGPDGTIYATFGSRLYAFAGTNTLADSPWPMYHQNARHTGKVEKPALKPLQQKRSDGNFQFELYAQLGQTNTLESTTNLSTWTSLTRVVATNVPMDVVDLTATNFPARFYRTSSP